mmetsp:Transcript_21686/g.48858  ORF Transcript_21686/g.48858 Transcript_21686/m.48858 type:complete len:231 (+) Transcript_21686:245-937(+)
MCRLTSLRSGGGSTTRRWLCKATCVASRRGRRGRRRRRLPARKAMAPPRPPPPLSLLPSPPTLLHPTGICIDASPRRNFCSAARRTYLHPRWLSWLDPRRPKGVPRIGWPTRRLMGMTRKACFKYFWGRVHTSNERRQILFRRIRHRHLRRRWRLNLPSQVRAGRRRRERAVWRAVMASAMAAAMAPAMAPAVAAAAAVGGEGESSTVQVVDSSGKQADELDDFFSSLYD